jgi:hypothetical protein
MTTPNHFSYTINGKQAHITDATPTPIQLLSEAGFEPAEDYVLIERTPHGTKATSSDDVLDVSNSDAEFFAFQQGVIFQLTINGHSLVWGSEEFDVAVLRRVANVPDDSDVVLQLEDQPDQVLPAAGMISLRAAGIEHLKTRKRVVHTHVYHFFVDGTKYSTESAELTGAQIMAMIPSWDPTNSLVLESHGSEPDQVIRPTTVVNFSIRKGDAHFAIVPPATFGAYENA